VLCCGLHCRFVVLLCHDLLLQVLHLLAALEVILRPPQLVQLLHG
jgi:hypothetical protein